VGEATIWKGLLILGLRRRNNTEVAEGLLGALECYEEVVFCDTRLAYACFASDIIVRGCSIPEVLYEERMYARILGEIIQRETRLAYTCLARGDGFISCPMKTTAFNPDLRDGSAAK